MDWAQHMIRPRPRPQVFDIYWKFAYERQRVFESRVSGAPGPWTADPILQEYKFCNVYRAADRVSQYLIREICYSGDASTVEDRVFQIVAFRTFSNTQTWDDLVRLLGHNPTIRDLESGAFGDALNHIRAARKRLYTGAFILCATDAYGRKVKHLNHVELFKDMFLNGRLAEKIMESRSLRDVYDLLHGFPLMGDFMSYQTAIDLNYSDIINFSENDFTQPGPGALRGIKKVFSDVGRMTPSDVVMWMVENQEQEFERLELDFRGLWGRPIQAIDAQNLFCETDKYCREAVPALTSARSRIKSRFKPAEEPMRLFFPPKWGINHHLPTEEVLGNRLHRELALF
jgi:hypothetical protein